MPPAPCGHDGRVKLEQIHAGAPEPPQARFHRGHDKPLEVRQVFRVHPDLGADVHVRLEVRQHLAQIGLGLAAPVVRGGIEVVDAEVHGAGHRRHLLLERPPHHQSADVAAAEPDLRYSQSCFSYITIVHGQPLE